MSLIIAAGAYFPISWVAFAFAPSAMRWTWICYQLYLLVTFLVFMYGDLLRVGSLEEDVAEALRLEKTVYLGDEGTGHITIGFEEVQASGSAEAREIVEPKKLEILGTGKKDTWASDP